MVQPWVLELLEPLHLAELHPAVLGLPAVVRLLGEGADGLVLSRGLLHALLEELHISDDFDVLVGRVACQPTSPYPRLLAIALLLRHSWCPQEPRANGHTTWTVASDPLHFAISNRTS